MPDISRRTFLHSSFATAVSAATLGHTYQFRPVAQPTLPIPPLLSGWRDGKTTVYDLTVQRGTTEFFAGTLSETFGYNGNLLGPVLRMRRGERVRLNVTNRLGEPTTCHWHGFHVPAVADGGPHQIIQPDTTWQASFKVLNEAATYWYHSHHEGHTAEQVYKGLAGMIIVDDPGHDAGSGRKLPRRYGVDDIPLVIQDRRFSTDGELLYLQGGWSAVMVNGALAPSMRVPAQLVRLRLLNGSNARVFDFGLSDDRPFSVIASDGGLLAAPVSLQRLSMTNGERYEIVVDLSSDAGRTLQLMSYSPVDGAGITIVDIVVDPAIRTVPASVPQTLGPAPYIDPAGIVRTRPFVFGTGFTINGVLMDKGVINETVPLGAIEEWLVSNNTTVGHPFHIHDGQFLVRSRNGLPPPEQERGWKDTFQVWPGEVVSVLVHFTDFADPVHPYMYHCHILEHEDLGMMGQFVVVGSSGGRRKRR